MLSVLGVCGKVLAAGVATGRISQGLPHAGHSWFWAAPTDPAQHTAECSSHNDGNSGKTLVTKGKTLVRKGSEGKQEFKKQPCKCQCLTGMWRGCSGQQSWVSLACGREPSAAGISLQSVERVCWSRHPISLQSAEDPTLQNCRWVFPWKELQPMESLCWSRALPGWSPDLEQTLLKGTAVHRESPGASLSWMAAAHRKDMLELVKSVRSKEKQREAVTSWPLVSKEMTSQEWS